MTVFRIALLAIAGLLLPIGTTASATDTDSGREGTWTADRMQNSLQLHLRLSQHSYRSLTIPWTSLQKTGDGLVLKREAGVLTLTGPFDGQRGGGMFTFMPDPSFRNALRSRGLGSLTDREQLKAALADLTVELIDELRKVGYDETLKNYLKMSIHRATPAYVRALKAVGYDDVPAKRLVKMRVHGVEPDFIRAMTNAGYGQLSPKELTKMKIHGVTPAFANELREAGVEAPARQLVKMKIHGVTSSFAEEIRKAGVDATAKQLVKMKIHGVTPAFVKEARDAGIEATARQLVKMKIRGVTPRSQ